MATVDILSKTIGPWTFTERVVEVPFVYDSLPPPPARTLDVGCTGSLLLECLAELGYEAYGIDPREVSETGHTYLGYPRYLNADAREIPFRDNFFDAVTCVSVIEHIGFSDNPYIEDEYEEDADILVMQEMVRVLKPGGVCLVTFAYGEMGENAAHYRSWVREYNKERVDRMIPPEIDNFHPRYWVRSGEVAPWEETTEEKAAVVANQNLILSVLCFVARKRDG